jgi:hypothetical protein
MSKEDLIRDKIIKYSKVSWKDVKPWADATGKEPRLVK